MPHTPGQCQVVGNICIHLRSENELEVEGTTKRCVCAAKSYLIVSNIFRFSFPGAATPPPPRKHFLCWKEMQFYLSFFIATSLVAIVAQVGGSRRSFSMSELENH